MNGKLRLKVAMAMRVRDLLVANPFGDPPADQLSAQFVDRVARAEVLLTQSESGDIASRGSTRHRRQLRGQLRTLPLRHVLKVAQLVAVDHPEAASGIKRLPFGMSESEFLATARAIAQQVEAQRDLFLAHGMSSASLDELNRMLGEYEQALRDANGARRSHTGARAELRQLTRELMRMVAVFDGLVLFAFRDRPELLGAWVSARNVAWPGEEPVRGGDDQIQPAA